MYDHPMNRQDLIAAYSASGRHYHGLKHIEDCLGALEAITDLSERDRAILIEALWWHDVVYDPTKRDNEEQSARLAEQHVDPDIRAEVGRLIRLTRSHEVAPGDRRGAVLISIDLGILGADPATYDLYADAIRKEFAHVPDADYRSGRARVLKRFLDRPVIYPEPSIARQLDRMARENLAREIAALG